MSTPKKITRIIIIILVLIGAYGAWVLFGSGTSFDENKKSFYIKSYSEFETVANDLKQEGFIKDKDFFKMLAGAMKYNKIKAGRYIFSKGVNMFSIIRKLKSGVQDPVNLVINKLRTKEDLAKKIAASFECDSATFIELLNNNEKLAEYGLDTNTAMTSVIPNTYSIFWTTPGRLIFKKLNSEKDKFWTEERKQKAQALGLTPTQVYIVASIVEEETNKEEDKGKIASVYLNRLDKGMRLGADPTVKFAMKNFALKRIYEKYLSFPSPYNTYINSGLPPGPICTPSAKTIDAVLNAPATSYLFFVAKPDFNGYSNFATTYEEHLRYAKAYQKALDSLMKAKQVQ